MGDGYWNNRQQPQPQPQPPMPAIFKRPRSDYELPPSGLPSAHEMHNYLARDDNRGGPSAKEAKTLGSSYDLYLQNPPPPFTSGEASNYGGVGLGRAIGGGPAFGLVDPVSMAPNGRVVEYGGRVPVDPMDRPGREPLPLPLPPDASNTLYIEGLPPNSTKREVAHIFRPFVGYKEVRLVSKESKHRGGDPLILCFVDFINPACAATALSALQGYKMDEHEPDSAYLRLQFSKFPGPRSGSGSGSRSRGKR